MNFNIVNNTDLQITVNESEDGTITLTIDEVKKNERCLGDVKSGEIVKFGEREYIVLGYANDTTAIITKDFATNMAFGRSGDYLTSDVRKYCNGEFYKELASAIGAENIVKHTVNLTADDGTGENVTCCDNVSIITNDNYRRYRKFLKAYGDWWWTATRVNYDDKDYARGVCCVYPDGVLVRDDCGCRYGVRPFCILKSSVIVK